MATKAPVYKVVPTTTLQASDADYSSQLDAALFQAKFDHQELCFVSSDGRPVFCNRSLISLFSKSIRDILDSSIIHQIPDTEPPKIIVPGCSFDSLYKVHDILLRGSTSCSISSFKDINEVVETAKALGIEMKDLGFVPYSNIEQRRQVPQHLPNSAPPKEPNTVPYKVKIPSAKNVDIKKEKVDEDISIVGFAGDPNKAVPLNLKVEDPEPNKNILYVNDQFSNKHSVNNRESMKMSGKKKKQKSAPTESPVLKAPGAPKGAKFERSKKPNPNKPPPRTQRPNSFPKSFAKSSKPCSFEESRTISKKNKGFNKVNHSKVSEHSDDELAFTLDTNHSTPPYTKTSIVKQDDPVSMVSPNSFEEPDGENPGNLVHSFESGKIVQQEEIVESVHSEGYLISDVVEQVPESCVEEEVYDTSNDLAHDNLEVGPMEPLMNEPSAMKVPRTYEFEGTTTTEEPTDHELEINQDEELEECSVNDSSFGMGEHDYDSTENQNDVNEEVVPTNDSFHGFPDLEAKVKEAEKRLQKEHNRLEQRHDSVSEIENVEQQIKQLERELDNTVDNEEVYENLASNTIPVPRDFAFQEESNVDEPAEGLISEDGGGEKFIEYKETDINASGTNYGKDDETNKSKSILVDNYINDVIEKDMSLGTSNHEDAVSEDMERIFGAGVEEFDANLRNNQTGPMSSMIHSPSDKLANLIGSNTISIERSHEQMQRKPDPSTDYSSLRIERVGAKSREPGRHNVQVENQSVRIERVGSADRARPRPRHESWTTGRGKVPEEPEDYNPDLYEDYSELEGGQDQDVYRNMSYNYGTEFAVPKRFRSNSPDIGSNYLPIEKPDNLEMSMAKRNKKFKHGMKGSKLDLQISKIKQNYKSLLPKETLPRVENDFVPINSVDTLSNMTIPELLEASKAAVSLQNNPRSQIEPPTPPIHSSPIIPKKTMAQNHACVICNKNDFSGSNDNNRLTAIKAHYCNHFMAEILDLHKNEIMGNTCMVDMCNMTIMDKGEKKRNLARHIGTKHNKIYKIMKLRGHKIDFLKQREEKPKSKENKITEMGEIGLQNSVMNPVYETKPAIPAPVIEKKPSKSVDKIECNFCKRKYSNTYNLRKHILSAHDKVLE